MMVTASMIWNTSASGRPDASSRNQPVLFSATIFRYVMLPELSAQTLRALRIAEDRVENRRKDWLAAHSQGEPLGNLAFTNATTP